MYNEFLSCFDAKVPKMYLRVEVAEERRAFRR